MQWSHLSKASSIFGSPPAPAGIRQRVHETLSVWSARLIEKGRKSEAKQVIGAKGGTRTHGFACQIVAFDFVTSFRSKRHRQPQAIFDTICSLMERRFTPRPSSTRPSTDQQHGWICAEDPVSLANGSDRNFLIAEMAKSVQESSVRAYVPSVPCGGKRMNQEEIDRLPAAKLEANSTCTFARSLTLMCTTRLSLFDF